MGKDMIHIGIGNSVNPEFKESREEWHDKSFDVRDETKGGH